MGGAAGVTAGNIVIDRHFVVARVGRLDRGDGVTRAVGPGNRRVVLEPLILRRTARGSDLESDGFRSAGNTSRRWDVEIRTSPCNAIYSPAIGVTASETPSDSRANKLILFVHIQACKSINHESIQGRLNRVASSRNAPKINVTV